MLLDHVAAELIMILASGFTELFIEALIIALGHAPVEAAATPLITALKR